MMFCEGGTMPPAKPVKTSVEGDAVRTTGGGVAGGGALPEPE
jgi:hypothetical protein